MKLFKLLAFLFFLGLPFVGFSSTPVLVEFSAEEETIQPGKPFWVALSLDIDEGWHAYWKNPGDVGLPIHIEWKIPAGFEIDSVEWPTPKKFDLDGIVGFGYDKKAIFLVKMIPSFQLEPGKIQNFYADIKWLVCSSSTCLPGRTESVLALLVDDKKPQLNAKFSPLFSEARSKLPQKHEDIVVLRKNGIIQIQLPGEYEFADNEFELDFYPENSSQIDLSKSPVLSLVEESHQVCALLNEKMDESNAHLPSLAGILLIKNKTDPRSESIALSIDHSIAEADSSQLIVSQRENRFIHQEPNLSIPVATAHEFEGGFMLAVAFAFLGGMILNLMPCVLPVISFKIMSFIKMAGQKRSLVMRHGFAFSSGVIVSFWCLAGVMFFLQAYGRSVGWGFQLQEPLFVAALSALLLIFGLNMFGVFEVGLGVASWAGQVDSDSSDSTSFLGSFISGVLATAVATPCTGPFLGSAMGFAFTLPVPLAFIVFTSLGLGMSFPYLIFTAFPSLMKFLPRPGAWMMTFKELMGFVMLATVLWLVWVFGAQTSNIAVVLLLTSFLLISIACWIYGKWSLPVTQSFGRIVAFFCVFGLLVLSGVAIITASSEDVANLGNGASATVQRTGSIRDWEPFSPERVAELQKQGTPVFVDFTAKWCLICQANHLVLSQDKVVEKMVEVGVVKMKADWTKSDELITQELKKFGRSGVPLYVFYGAGESQSPRILPQVLTAETILEHLDAIGNRSDELADANDVH